MAGPTQIRLDQALDQVVSAAHQRCVDARAAGLLLEDLSEVVKGDRARRRPDPPYLWVAAGAGEATQARAMHETWDVALLFNAFVQAEEPEQGWVDAFRYAARARSVVLARSVSPAGRNLGLPFVEDVRSHSIGALGHFTSGRRFGAFARVTVRLSLVETA